MTLLKRVRSGCKSMIALGEYDQIRKGMIEWSVYDRYCNVGIFVKKSKN